MKRFLSKIFWFTFILILPVIIGLLLPATPRASKSLLFSSVQKDSLLKNVAYPRIIFVGGSNLSFGLNSQMIKDSLNINPINTGIHASIGLSYMMSNSLKLIKQGDIVVLVPEYQQFYGDFAYGNDGEELTRTIFDVNISKIHLLGIRQLVNVFKVLPKYSLSKFKISEYHNPEESDIYSINSFNSYGDADKHWGLKKQNFSPYGVLGNQLNESVFEEIKSYQAEITKKKGTLFISYPGYQDSSYDNSANSIKNVEKRLSNDFSCILGTPERYKMPDSLMFNTPYHLSKNGVDYRTHLLIFDLKAGIEKSKLQ